MGSGEDKGKNEDGKVCENRRGARESKAHRLLAHLHIDNGDAGAKPFVSLYPLFGSILQNAHTYIYL